jgi:hypothetical protein
MHALLVLGVLGGFGLLWAVGKRYAEGEGPFERLPAGVPAEPLGSRVEESSDGSRYRVYFWPVTADDRQFHVAERKGEKAWISFWFDRPTGKRTLYMSLANAGELNDMRKDWSL